MKTRMRAAGWIAVGAMLIGGPRPAAAQNARPTGLLNLSAATLRAAAAAGEAAQAPATSDSAVLNFFRGTELSGFVDMYYSYNFDTPKTACATFGGVAVFNCLRNFDFTHNSFSLNLAEVALEKKPSADSRGGFRVDLDYGPTTAWVHGGEPGGTAIYQNIQQAYLSYLAPAGGGLQVDFGKFVTHNGAEVIETKDNWNYTRGLLFAWAIPYYHTGVRATYTASDQVTLMGEVTNGWNNAVDNNGGKTVGAEIIYKPTGAVSIIGNYTGGPEQNNNNSDWRHLFDAVVSYTATPKVSVLLNYDYAQDEVSGSTVKWQGIAGYLKYQANAWFALTPRVEYFDDTNGFSTGATQKVKEVTVTAEFKHKDGVLMRWEYRRDFSDVPFFIKNVNTLKKNQDTFTIGFVYAFSSKTS